VNAGPSPSAPIVLTCGESAGIGPDLCISVAQAARTLPLVCLADRELLRERAALLHLPCRIEAYTPGVAPAHAAGEL